MVHDCAASQTNFVSLLLTFIISFIIPLNAGIRQDARTIRVTNQLDVTIDCQDLQELK